MARPRGGLEQFYVQAYEPGKGESSPTIDFEAHIIGLTDSSTPQWNEEFDMGRPDPVMMYSSTNRSIQISFMMVAVTSAEQSQNYENLGKLGTLTYPIFEKGYGYNAPHVLFVIGGLTSGFGVITGLDYNWSPEYPWVGTPKKPVVTEVTLGIRILTDTDGTRPEFKNGDYPYFG